MSSPGDTTVPPMRNTAPSVRLSASAKSGWDKPTQKRALASRGSFFIRHPDRADEVDRIPYTVYGVPANDAPFIQVLYR